MGLYIALPIAAACILLRLPLTLILFRRRGVLELCGDKNRPMLRSAFTIFYGDRDPYVSATYLVCGARHAGTALVQSAVYVLEILFVPLAGVRFGADGICVLLFATQLAGCLCRTHDLSKARGAINLADMGAFGILLVAPMGASIWAGLRAVQFSCHRPVFWDSRSRPRVSLSLGVMAVVFVALTLLFVFRGANLAPTATKHRSQHCPTGAFPDPLVS